MTMSDPVADMLTRIRNAQKAKKDTVEVPASRFKAALLDVLAREGYIRGYKLDESDKAKKKIRVELKYDQGEGAIKEIHRISKPGRRVYATKNNMPRFYNGLGVVVVSTPHGVMADHEAREKNVGGEVLCQVF